MPRHKHADVIIAWANGEEIEIKHSGTGEWVPLPLNPSWAGDKYRIKPVKKEGWVNVYSIDNYLDCGLAEGVYKRKEDADQHRSINRVACVRIEWEEEV